MNWKYMVHDSYLTNIQNFQTLYSKPRGNYSITQHFCTELLSISDPTLIPVPTPHTIMEFHLLPNNHHQTAFISLPSIIMLIQDTNKSYFDNPSNIEMDDLTTPRCEGDTTTMPLL